MLSSGQILPVRFPVTIARGNDLSTSNQQVQGNEGGDTPPQGFEAQFFNEQGEFDQNSALNFITSNIPKSYDGVNDIVSPLRSPASSFQKPPVDPSAGPDPNSWEARFEAQTKAREEHDAPYMLWLDTLNKGLNELHLTGDQLLDYTKNAVRDAAGKAWAKREFQQQHESREAEDKRLAEERAYSELIPKSRTNLGVMYQRFKDGEAGFNLS